MLVARLQADCGVRQDKISCTFRATAVLDWSLRTDRRDVIHHQVFEQCKMYH